MRAQSKARGRRAAIDYDPAVVAAMLNFEANRLKLGSDLAELKRLAGWIESQQELSGETSFAIQLCIEEAVANVIMYGNCGKDDRLQITVHLEPQ